MSQRNRHAAGEGVRVSGRSLQVGTFGGRGAVRAAVVKATGTAVDQFKMFGSFVLLSPDRGQVAGHIRQ